MKADKMLWERIFFLLVYLSVTIESSHQQQADCYTSEKKRIINKATHSCTLQRSENVVPNISDWRPPPEEFQLHLKDPKHGVVTAKFPIPDKFRGFTIELLINKSAKTEEDCNKSQGHRVFEVHSTILIKRNHCNWINETSNCSSCGTVYIETELQHVFMGCYYLKVRPDEPKDSNKYSRRIFINSSYEKTYIQQPNLSYQYVEQKNTSFIEITSPWFGKIPFLFSMGCAKEEESGKPSCHTVGIGPSCCSSEMPNFGVLQCKANNENHKSPECYPKAAGISCTIFNVTPGNYYVRVQALNDVRCQKHKIWTYQGHTCIWDFNHEAAKTLGPGKTTVISPDSSISYAYVGLGVVASVAFVAAIIFAIRYSMKHLFSYEGRRKSSCTTRLFTKEKILLLYASDCSLFMDLMTTFRRILQKVSSWEVYDVFDPYQWNAIAVGRYEWVQRLLAEDDTVIIIVDSTSAVLHQNALENNYTINYFQPRPNSDLFSYALQMITNNVQRNAYEKIFVVRFSGFSEDGQTLKHIAPLRRYLLPDHFDQLLSSLKETSSHNLEGGSQDELRGIVELQICLDNLVFYKSENPDYLQSVLYKS